MNKKVKACIKAQIAMLKKQPATKQRLETIQFFKNKLKEVKQ